MLKTVLVLAVMVIATFFLVIYHKRKNSTIKTKNFIVMFVLFCTILYGFVILIYQPSCPFFFDRFPELYSDGVGGTWADTWLNIFSITISTITALIAIKISKQQKSMEDFSFYSNLEFIPFSDSFYVEEICDNVKLTQLKNVAELSEFPSQANKISFNLTNHLNPEIKYNLANVKIKCDNGIIKTEIFEAEKREVIFENYTLDNKTAVEITLITYQNEHHDLFIPIVGGNTYAPFGEKYKYEITFDFELKSINNYDFVNNKKYQITITLAGKELRSDSPNEPFQYKFLITKSNSEII